LELAVSEDVAAIYLHRRGMHLDSPVVRWSGRTPWRAYASAAAAELASWQHRGHWLVRIALHPGDLAHRAAAASIGATLDHWIARRSAWSYSALIQLMPSSSTHSASVWSLQTCWRARIASASC